MNTRTKYQIFIACTCVILLGIGLYIGLQISQEDDLPTTVDVVTKPPDEVKIYNEEPVSVKKYDIEVIYETLYSLCNEVVTSKDMTYGTTITDLKEKELQKQKEEKITYDIVEESKDRLVFRRVLNQNCPNHFLVKSEEEGIVIYQIVTEASKTEYQKLDIPQELIRAELLEELKKGISVNSKEELNLLIEDLES